MGHYDSDFVFITGHMCWQMRNVSRCFRPNAIGDENLVKGRGATSVVGKWPPRAKCHSPMKFPSFPPQFSFSSTFSLVFLWGGGYVEIWRDAIRMKAEVYFGQSRSSGLFHADLLNSHGSLDKRKKRKKNNFPYRFFPPTKIFSSFFILNK